MCHLFTQGREDGLGAEQRCPQGWAKGNLQPTSVFYFCLWLSRVATLLPSPGSDPTDKARLWEETLEASAGVDPGRCHLQEPGAEGFSSPGAETALCTAI